MRAANRRVCPDWESSQVHSDSGTLRKRVARAGFPLGHDSRWMLTIGVPTGLPAGIVRPRFGFRHSGFDPKL